MGFKQNVMKKTIFSIILMTALSTNLLLAQTAGGEDFMRSIGKIYVVVAVLVSMFIGIVIYLISLDRKLTKLENQIKDNE